MYFFDTIKSHIFDITPGFIRARGMYLLSVRREAASARGPSGLSHFLCFLQKYAETYLKGVISRRDSTYTLKMIRPVRPEDVPYARRTHSQRDWGYRKMSKNIKK